MTTDALTPAATRAASVLNRAICAILNFFRSFAQNLAYARMVRMMHEMSDAQLARIGVARKDIPAHALAITRSEDAAGAANLN